MAVTDWQPWAAGIEKQLADLSKRVVVLESNNISAELRQTLTEIRIAIGVMDQKSNALLTRQERQRLQLEAIAAGIMDESALAEMDKKLKQTETDLTKAVESQKGPEPS